MTQHQCEPGARPRRRYDMGSGLPATPPGADGRIAVPLIELLAAIDALELAAMTHAEAQRRDEPQHVEATRRELLASRAAVHDLARRACEGSTELQRLIRGVYEHMLMHNGRRAAARLRPWLR